MATKFAAFLTAKKIDIRRIAAASNDLERLRPEDRTLRLAKRIARGGESTEAQKEAAKGKARSGRPVTARAIQAALKGTAIAGPTKTRILAAVNVILTQKKQAAATLKDLF